MTTTDLQTIDRNDLPAPVSLADHVSRQQAVAEFVQGRRDSGPQARLAWLRFDDDTEVPESQRHRAMTGIHQRVARPADPLKRWEKLNLWALVLMLSAAASIGGGPVALTTPNYVIAALFGALGLAFGIWSLVIQRRDLRRAARRH